MRECPPTAASIKAAARTCGFDLCGIAPAVKHPRLARLAEWIASGRAGDMTYLAASLDERLDPVQVLPGARSVISLGTLYNADVPYSTSARTPERAVVARYAWGEDYHDVVRERLSRLLRWLADAAGPGLEAFSCVDNGPVQERVFAEQAGLGWIGKNTCLINPQLGSWVFLSEIISNLDLAADAPAQDQCGTCTRCLEACPTGALTEPYALDATRCVSYLTIETRGDVRPELRGAIGPEIFGCDVCQDVCPWNRRHVTSAGDEWQPREELAAPRLMDLCAMSDEAWRRVLRGSAMRRAGLSRLRRSLAYATRRLPAHERADALAVLESQPSAADPVVGDAIAWSRGAT